MEEENYCRKLSLLSDKLYCLVTDTQLRLELSHDSDMVSS